MHTLGLRQLVARISSGLLILFMLFLPVRSAQSQSTNTTLSIQPITWDVVGLDSNDVNAGPNQFLVGARVCNTGANAATNVVSNFVWDSAEPYINLIPGSYTSLSVTSLAVGACTDFYYNAEITRTALAYDALPYSSRQYHITAQATNAPQVATPAGRQLYVERLISQNRNSIASITCPLTNPPAGTSACDGTAGSYIVQVGRTYEFTFVHNTATQGYEQIESFVNFPNLLFQIQSVSSTYSEPVSYTSDRVYQDACGWDPIGRTCVGPIPLAFRPRGTSGGAITSRYRVYIIGPGSATVSGVIYDFSGSSFHYNSDFGTSAGTIGITAVVPPDLSLTKSDGGATAAPGGTIAYTLSYANAVGGAAAGVTLRETVPTNTTFNAGASTAGWACTPNNNAGSICTLAVGALNSGAGGSATFAVMVANPLPAGVAQIANTASIADNGASGTDPTPGNNTASDTTPVNAAPNLGLTKSDGGVTRAPGGAIAYTLSYQNSGNQGATGVVLTETVPANTTFNAAASTAGWTCAPNNAAGSTCTLAVGAVNAAGGGSVTFAVTVANPLPAGVTQASNTASVADDGSNGADPVPGDNSASDTTPLDAAPDFSLTKTGPAAAAPGELLTYSLNYANNGTQGATGVFLTETVPPNTTFDPAASTAGWACAPNNNAGSICTLAVGGLSASQNGSAAFAVRLLAPIPAGLEQLTNTASIGDDENNGTDPTPGNNTGNASTLITAAPDLSITKSDGGFTALPGGTVSYTLTYANTGSQNASGVVLTETVPANTTFNAGASTAGWTCAPNNAAGSTCSLTVGMVNVATGGSATFAVTAATPLPAGVEQIANTAGIHDDGQSGTDPTPENNSGSDTTPLNAAPDLAVTKTDNDASATPGGAIVYHLGYGNTGTQAASGVSLTETVPANTTFNPGASTAGWACAPNNNAGSTCTLPLGGLAIGQTGTANFAVTVNAPLPAGVTQVSNTAGIGDDGASGADSNPDNNSASDTTPVTSAPDLTLAKSDNGVTGLPGGTVVYTLTVTNQGAVPASGVVLTETVPANTTFNAGASTAGWACTPNNAAGATCTLDAGTLDAGATSTAAFAVSLPNPLSPAVTQTSNTARVADDGTHGADPTPGNNTAADDTPITVLPGLHLEKTAEPQTYSALDEIIHYTFTLTNTGNVTLSQPFVVNDPLLAADCTAAAAVLPPNASTTCSGDYTITQADLDDGEVTNTATASGTLLGSPVNTNPASATITADPRPALRLEKDASISLYEAVGEVIDYTYRITNTGNVSISGPFSVADDRIPVDCSMAAEALGPGEWTTCGASYTVQQEDLDAGQVINNATATGLFRERPVTSPEVREVVEGYQMPSLALEKRASLLTYTAANEVISYTYTLTNDGNVTLNGPFTVTDDRTTVDCSRAANVLAPGISTTCTATYTITQADVNAGSVTNTATAHAGSLDSNTAEATVTAARQPGMRLSKTYTGYTDSDSSGALSAGDVLNYRLTAANSGNVTLTHVTISDPLLARLICEPQQPADLDPGTSLVCTGAYTLQQSDLDNNGGGDGDIDNTASAVSDQTPSQSASAVVPLPIEPGLGLAKRLVSTSEVSPGTYDVTFALRVVNMGNVALNSLQISDDLAAAFPQPTTFTVRSLTSAELSENSAYNGRSDTHLLTGTDTLAAQASGTLTLVVRVVPASAGPFRNSASAAGGLPGGASASDISQDGSDPDPDHNGDAGDNSDPTPVSFGPRVFDPPMGVKTVDVSGVPVLRWTMTWINNTNITALNALVSDPLPEGLTYLAAGAASGYPLPAAAPTGSTTTGVTCTDTSSVTSTTACYYESPSTAYPRGRVVWQGTLGPDFGILDPNAARNAIRIAFNTRVASEANDVRNNATIDADLNGDGDTGDSGEQQVASAAVSWRRSVSTPDLPGHLPATGFAPGRVTSLVGVPAASYSSPGDLSMEIPALKLNLPVVGVPLKDGDWNLAWLWQQAGWLEGTAFPSLKGNSVLTGHVTLPSGLPGPFAQLKNLAWGDKIIIHAFGQSYVYQVRAVEQVRPEDTSVLEHKDQPWLTLLTCKEFDEKTNTYRARLVVRAVLVEVK